MERGGDIRQHYSDHFMRFEDEQFAFLLFSIVSCIRLLIKNFKN
jgi:hypothetical protein